MNQPNQLPAAPADLAAPALRDDSFSTLFEFLPIGAYRSSPAGRQLRANPALVRLNGFASEAEQLAAVSDIATAWYVDSRRRDDFERLLEQSGTVVAFESEVWRYKTRERIWISENAHVVRDTAGKTLYYEGTVEEITQRVHDSQALRDNSQLWKQALESTGDGVWDWNLVTGVEQLSPRCKALYGFGPDDLLDSPDALDGLTHPDDRPGMLRDREAHFAGLTARYVNEHRVRCKDGNWKWVLSRGVVISRDADGKPLRMIGTHTDISVREQAGELRRQRDMAQAADVAKSQFLSRVSHELRTPLNAVLGFAQLLELEASITADARHLGWVKQVLASGRHLLGLMDDILDLSSAQTGELPVHPEPLLPGPLVDEAWKMVAHSAQPTRLRFCNDAAGADTPLVLADRKRLRQVLVNLLSNAVKYNRADGWVTVAVSLKETATAAAPGDDSQVLLSVADSGVGLSTDQVGRLFQPFERLGAQRGPVPGTGLGLALSRQLVQAMGGSLVASSTLGEGSVFTLTLPRGQGQGHAEPTHHAPGTMGVTYPSPVQPPKPTRDA